MSLDFVAGCIGGVAGVLVGHPLDTVKVQLQTQDAKNPKYQGTLHCIRSLIAKQGVRGVYRGVTSPVFGVAGINAICFGVYGNAQKSMQNANSLKSHAVAGAASGLLQSFITSPMELVKSRMQISETTQTPWNCLRKIYGKEGVRGIFRGLGITTLREVPAFSSYFVTYEILTRTEDSALISTTGMMLAGGFAGVVSWVISYPVDTVKTRIQTTSEYTSSYDCVKKILKTSGVPGFFPGLAPTILRAFPVNAVIFTVVTWTMRLFDGGLRFTESVNLTGTVKQTETILERYTDVVGKLGVVEKSPL